MQISPTTSDPGLSQVPQQYVRYTPSVEAVSPEEQRVINEITATFGRIGQKTAEHYQHAVRGVHAKSHAILKGNFEVLGNLPFEFRQGLFSEAKSYPVVVRLSASPGDVLSDKVSASRGFALKVIGIRNWPMIAQHAGEVTQDFLFSNGKYFPAKTIDSFLSQLKLLETETTRLPRVKEAVSGISRAANACLRALGAESASLDFFGHPPKHFLADSFGSQAPIRYGDYIAKMLVRPSSALLAAVGGLTHDLGKSFSVIQEDLGEFFESNSAEFDLCVQLCTDLKKMPVEDASVEWSEHESPYVPVARIIFPMQISDSPTRKMYGDDVLSFSPAHSLEAHRPLGSIMRARLQVYGPSSQFRHLVNARPSVEPRSSAEIPD